MQANRSFSRAGLLVARQVSTRCPVVPPCQHAPDKCWVHHSHHCATVCAAAKLKAPTCPAAGPSRTRSQLRVSLAAAPAAAPPAKKAASFFDPVKQSVVAVPEDVAALFQPVRVGSLQLAHRIVMAPLTRCRAIDRTPTPAMALYYGQRASRGGLIISEATVVSPYGAGYANTPGMYTDAQVAAWRPVVDAVHAKGGAMVCQLLHAGRIAAHSDHTPGYAPPVAPSAIAPKQPAWNTRSAKGDAVPFEMPHALERHEIKEVVRTWGKAAERAMAASFDGVEIQGGLGYLVEQFLKDSCNTRSDEYGGSIANRARFALEVTQAAIAAVGDAGRVGIRLTPFMDVCDATDSTPYATYVYLAEQLRALKVAYVHMAEPAPGPAAQAVSSGHCDLVAFGHTFLSTPDLPARLLADVAPNEWDQATLYTQDQVKGYTDYPFMAA